MLKPSDVGAAFKHVESDNYKFRTYLKNHADEDELDEQFLALHNELFAKYDCSQCRNCCKEYQASFEKEEIDAAAAFLGLTEAEFTGRYMIEHYGEYMIQMKPCCFLDEDGSCELEACKPASCRNFPYTACSGRLFSLISTIEHARICPVVFEMLERLKQIYHFKPKNRNR
jgi:hypothetical protein